MRSSASLIARSMSHPSDASEGKPGSPPRPLETHGIPRQSQSHTAPTGDQSSPLNGEGGKNHGSTLAFDMNNAPGAMNSPPASRNESPIPPRGFPKEITSSTQPAPSSPREENGSSSTAHEIASTTEVRHERYSPPEKPNAAEFVSSTLHEPENPSKTIHSMPAPIVETEGDGVPSRAHMYVNMPYPRSGVLEAFRQTPPDSSKKEARIGHSWILSPNDQDSSQGSKPRIKTALHPSLPNDPSPMSESSRENDELNLLISSETLPCDLQTDEELDSDQGAGGLAEMVEDSSCFRYDTWKKLRDSDMADNERRAAALKPALLALQKASAQFSASNRVVLPVQKQRPLWGSPLPTPTPGMQARIPLPSPPTHHPKSPPAGIEPYIQPQRASPPVLPSQPLARRHPTMQYSTKQIIGGRPIAPPKQHSYTPRAMSSFAPYGKASVQVTKEQIRDAIPGNASCIFHILDRRVNLDAHAPDASFYSLLRSWVQDDPYRQMPPLGSNIFEYVSLPSERRIEERRSIVRPKRKLEDIGTCDVFAKLQTATTPVAELSPKKLREQLVAGSKRIKRQKQKEYLAEMEASWESLRSLGIVLPKT